jgi:hypothetical protein
MFFTAVFAGAGSAIKIAGIKASARDSAKADANLEMRMMQSLANIAYQK